MPGKYIKRILEANVYDVADQTRLDLAAMLSERIGHKVLLKREDYSAVADPRSDASP